MTGKLSDILPKSLKILGLEIAESHIHVKRPIKKDEVYIQDENEEEHKVVHRRKVDVKSHYSTNQFSRQSNAREKPSKQVNTGLTNLTNILFFAVIILIIAFIFYLNYEPTTIPALPEQVTEGMPIPEINDDVQVINATFREVEE